MASGCFSVTNAAHTFQSLFSTGNFNAFFSRAVRHSRANFNNGKRLKIVCEKTVSSRETAERIAKADNTSVNSNDGQPTENTVKRRKDGFVMPKLPGDEPDFWEGPQWDAFGFFIQYLWAFGIVFALIACGIAVRTYNDRATDFKETPVYKESLKSRGLFEETPETSDSQVFETNPTEEAPVLQ